MNLRNLAIVIGICFIFQSCALLKNENQCIDKSIQNFEKLYSLDLLNEEYNYVKENISCGEEFNKNAVSLLMKNIYSRNKEVEIGNIELQFLLNLDNKDVLLQIMDYSRTIEGKSDIGIIAISIYAGLAARGALKELDSDSEVFFEKMLEKAFEVQNGND